MQIIDGQNEKQREVNVKNVQNIKCVNDHGKNILICMVGMNL
jgi:hypothetical protein